MKSEAASGRIGAVGARSVQRIAGVDEHRAGAHLRRRDLLRERGAIVAPPVAARDQARRTVVGREISHRPHCGEHGGRAGILQGVEAGVAMDSSGGLARVEVHHAGVVDLKARAVGAEYLLGDRENQWMLNEIPSGGTLRQQGAYPPGAVTFGTRADSDCYRKVRIEFTEQAHHFGSFEQVAHDGDAVGRDRGCDFLRRDICLEGLQSAHRRLLRGEPPLDASQNATAAPPGRFPAALRRGASSAALVALSRGFRDHSSDVRVDPEFRQLRELFDLVQSLNFSVTPVSVMHDASSLALDDLADLGVHHLGPVAAKQEESSTISGTYAPA